MRIITYQRLFQLFRNVEEMERLRGVNLMVFDEFHAVMHDALFVGCTGEVLQKIPEVFHAANRIYISATPEASLNELAIAEEGHCYGLTVYHFARSFAHVDPYFFTEPDQIIERINGDTSDEKWLIFVPSLKHMMPFRNKLRCTASIVSAATRNAEPEAWEKLLCQERFGAKVLLATAVIDAGVNFHDVKLANIVSFSLDPEEVIQQLGRKRRLREQERVRLFLREPSMQTVSRRLYRLREMQTVVIQAKQKMALFFDNSILKREEADYRRLCFMDQTGEIRINPLAYPCLEQKIQFLQKLHERGQRQDGDCGFAREMLRTLRKPIQISADHWLDDRYSKNAEERWLRFLKENVGRCFDVPEDRQQFVDRIRKRYTEAFGKRKNDRADREWGVTVINRVLRESNTGLVLQTTEEGSWMLRKIINHEEERS